MHGEFWEQGEIFPVSVQIRVVAVGQEELGPK